jgi:hypothetical protein
LWDFFRKNLILLYNIIDCCAAISHGELQVRGTCSGTAAMRRMVFPGITFGDPRGENLQKS